VFHVLLKIVHYQISVVQTGYEQQERPLELASSSPTRLTLTLKIKGNVESFRDGRDDFSLVLWLTTCFSDDGERQAFIGAQAVVFAVSYAL
jgi:hypothetical protein